jgi:homoserine O-succinyltransferase
VHLAVSPDGFRMVFFQGHPEYDTISLLKEYKREVMLFADGQRDQYPPAPDHYVPEREAAILDEYRDRLTAARDRGQPIPSFPEQLIKERLDNTWHDTAEAIVSNWMGLVYQITHKDRRQAFMEGVDPANPLGNLSLARGKQKMRFSLSSHFQSFAANKNGGASLRHGKPGFDQRFPGPLGLAESTNNA